jgi:hypothetical protein
VTVNWGAVVASVISGIVVSWPGVAATVWLSHRRLQGHIDRQTSQQTKALAQMTDTQTANIEVITNEQTRTMLGRRRFWRSNRHGGAA